MFRFLAFFAALPLLLACAPSPGQAQSARPGWVVGKVVDNNGHPIAGAEIFIGYQSLSGGRYGGYGASHNRTGRTGRDGTYAIKIADMAMGEYGAWAQTVITQNGQRIEVELTPDNEDMFANNAATVRNFRLEFAEKSANSDYGVGGTVTVRSSVNDYTPLQDVELTLKPVGSVAGGQGGTITKKLRSTGEGWVITGVPYGTYEVVARYKGGTMLIRRERTPIAKYEWGNSVTAKFEEEGPKIYQMRLEVEAR